MYQIINNEGQIIKFIVEYFRSQFDLLQRFQQREMNHHEYIEASEPK